MAESSKSWKQSDAMSATSGVMEKLDFHLKLVKKCMEEVQGLLSPKFNNEQCYYLVDKLDMAMQSASLFLEGSQVQSSGPYIPMHFARQVNNFELLVALAKQVESFVQSCSQDTWMQSALTLANVAAYISSLGFKLELCKIALNYGKASPKSLTMDEVFKISKDEVKVVKERASIDANILLKNVTLELYSSNPENCNLAKYLVHLLVGVQPKPTFDDNNSLLRFFGWVVFGKKDRQIGGGASAKVYEVVWLGIPVAKKTFYGPENEEFLKEVEILSKLRHPNITSMFCYHINKWSCSIIMELMDGDLRHMIDRRSQRNNDAPPFTILEGIDLMLQVGEGVNYLHDERIVHRDLKSSNILVKNVEVSGSELGYVQAKVVDFGLSKTKEHSISYSTISFNTGTCRWLAPEVINCYQVNQEGSKAIVELPKYVFKVDIYSFAMVCFEILTGEVPFNFERKLSKVKEKVLKGARPKIPDYCPLILKSLIEKCWSQNPSERPCIGDICMQLKYIKYLLMTNSDDFMVSSKSMETDIMQTKTDCGLIENSFSFQFGSFELIGDVSTSERLSARPSLLLTNSAPPNLDEQMRTRSGEHARYEPRPSPRTAASASGQQQNAQIGKRNVGGASEQQPATGTVQHIQAGMGSQWLVPGAPTAQAPSPQQLGQTRGYPLQLGQTPVYPLQLGQTPVYSLQLGQMPVYPLHLQANNLNLMGQFAPLQQQQAMPPMEIWVSESVKHHNLRRRAIKIVDPKTHEELKLDVVKKESPEIVALSGLASGTGRKPDAFD